VILIVGAGGGFKEVLLETKIADAIGQWAAHAHLSPLVLAWTAAAVVRVATGSATVATITGAGIVAPLVQNDTMVNRELLVPATGSGSLILSHVNDAGFWLVKEVFISPNYFNPTDKGCRFNGLLETDEASSGPIILPTTNSARARRTLLRARGRQSATGRRFVECLASLIPPNDQRESSGFSLIERASLPGLAEHREHSRPPRSLAIYLGIILYLRLQVNSLTFLFSPLMCARKPAC
jgi:GntP family permease